MTRALLDINVLIALLDRDHVDHERVRRWVDAEVVHAEYHQYWSCSVSLLDDELIDRSRLHGHRQVADAYLLAHATANGGRFATLDQSIPIDSVRHASARNLTVI